MHTSTPLWQRVLARFAVAVVAVVAAVVSYGHMQHVAFAAGELFYQLVPLSVDGMVVAGSLAVFAATRHGVKASKMTLFSLSVGLLVSVAANVYAPFLPENASTHNPWLLGLVGAWPAIALALSFESLLRLRLPAKKDSDVATENASDAASNSSEADSSVALVEEAERIVTEAASTVAASNASDHSNDPYNKIGAAWSGAIAPVAASKHYDSSTAAMNERQLARQLYRENPDAWTGKTLGERFGKSPSWGRLQIREANNAA